MSPQNSQSINFSANRALHSPLSPLSPASPIYPDGIMSPLWLEKHQYNVPAVFVSFVTFSSDSSRNSLNDNHLKNEINNIKSVFTRSGHRTRYAVVLISEKTILESPDIEERLSIIRKATGLDPKTSLFFLPPNTSRVELSTFATSLLSALQPVCIEYYRDLTKHARRKKNRGTVPPPTAPPTKGTSQALSALGWSIRYDFKGGIFAEFRQEMEAAGRNYTTALDTLLGSDGIFESTHSWSGRWDEARMLADALALRFIRCFLWNNQTTSAAQFWIRYRDSIKSVLDRRGKGTATYGWQVWLARWAKIMAELIQQVNVQSLRVPSARATVDTNTVQQEVLVYARAEKLYPVGERLPPWHLLAHPGYWYWLSAHYTMARRRMAEEIPEEDRTSPGQSPATRVANRSQIYDCYLCPEPHVEYTVDHGARIREALNLSSEEFSRRGQRRLAWRLDLDCAKELMRVKKYVEACNVLKPVWQSMTWRIEGWWRLAFEVIWTLYECAVFSKDLTLVVATSWELLSDGRHSIMKKGVANVLKHTLVFPLKLIHNYDLAHCADVLPTECLDEEEKLMVSLQGEDVCSFGMSSLALAYPYALIRAIVSMSFNFASTNGHVGENTLTQFLIRSFAHMNSAPVILSSVAMQFEGSLEQIRIKHDESLESLSEKPEKARKIQQITLRSEIQRNSTHIHSGVADLILFPGQTIILECLMTFREASEVHAIRANLSIDTPAFNLYYSAPIITNESFGDWYFGSNQGLHKRRLPVEDSSTITILPKPPKLAIELPSTYNQYYIGELVTLEVQLSNGEEEEANVDAEARIRDASGHEIICNRTIKPAESGSANRSNETFNEPEGVVEIRRMEPSEKRIIVISFTAPENPTSINLEITCSYHLVSEAETPISKSFSTNLEVSNPLEADYQASIYVHPEPWPNFFSVDKLLEQDQSDASLISSELDSGIARAWVVSAQITSFASDDLFIDSIDLVCQRTHGPATFTITPCKDHSMSRLAPNQQHVQQFELVVRTADPEERHPITLGLALDVRWRRAEPDDLLTLETTNDPGNKEDQLKSVTTSLLLSPFIISSPEPRAICTASRPADSPQKHRVILLEYTIENPTMHFLTFSTVMEASDEFAFSGSKSTSFNLVPLSRHTVQYHVMPLVGVGEGSDRIVLRPDLRITDVYFGQTLKVTAGRGVSMDKEGVFVNLL